MSPAGEPGATILVVDDEPAILGLIGTILWRAGYQVLEASAPSEALRICAEHPAPIRLVLTDIRMPEMNGYELAENLKAIRPEVKVLFMSGYTDQILQADTGRLPGDAPLIRKPFTQHNLITKVAELLDDGSASA
jgi:CheY-like chemotaxis protein